MNFLIKTSLVASPSEEILIKLITIQKFYALKNLV
jgi:hypothetical protein